MNRRRAPSRHSVDTVRESMSGCGTPNTADTVLSECGHTSTPTQTSTRVLNLRRGESPRGEKNNGLGGPQAAPQRQVCVTERSTHRYRASGPLSLRQLLAKKVKAHVNIFRRWRRALMVRSRDGQLTGRRCYFQSYGWRPLRLGMGSRWGHRRGQQTPTTRVVHRVVVEKRA
jgi:hypothetical protein